MSGLKKEESFTVDGVAIAAPSTYKPVFATTSTKSSKRDKGIVIGDMSDFTEENRKEYGIKILDYDYTYGDVDISIEGDTQGFTYTSDGGSDVLNGNLNKLELYQLDVAEIVNATEFQKPPKILNCKHVTTGGHLVFANDGATVQ